MLLFNTKTKAKCNRYKAVQVKIKKKTIKSNELNKKKITKN